MPNKKLEKEENVDLLVDFFLKNILLRPEPPTDSDFKSPEFKRFEEIAKKCSIHEWLRIIWKLYQEIVKRGQRQK